MYCDILNLRFTSWWFEQCFVCLVFNPFGLRPELWVAMFAKKCTMMTITEAMNHQYTDQGKEKKLGDDWQKDRTASGSLAFMSSKHHGFSGAMCEKH